MILKIGIKDLKRLKYAQLVGKIRALVLTTTSKSFCKRHVSWTPCVL